MTAEQVNRPYDTTLRHERAAETRDRIIDAGSELVHSGSIRDWKRLNIRAVASRAGVAERTVYRHFGNERGLADAVMNRLEQEAGISLAGMTLGDVAPAARSILDHVASYPSQPRQPLDPTLFDAGRRQRDALLAAVAAAAPTWSAQQQATAAALLDVLWSVESYERLTHDWELDHETAADGIAWLIGLVVAAVQDSEAS